MELNPLRRATAFKGLQEAIIATSPPVSVAITIVSPTIHTRTPSMPVTPLRLILSGSSSVACSSLIWAASQLVAPNQWCQPIVNLSFVTIPCQGRFSLQARPKIVPSATGNTKLLYPSLQLMFRPLCHWFCHCCSCLTICNCQ